MVEATSSVASGSTRRPPGSTDVARVAGVSQKTVSRVMNDEPHVSAAVRARVLEAARGLGYRPNTAARALNLGRFHRIGVVSLGSAHYGPATLLVAVERAARASGYSLSIVCTLEGQRHAIADAVESLLKQGVDGIVLSEPIAEGESLRLGSDVPILSFGEMPGLDEPHLAVTGLDNAAASRVATEHLIGLGHQTVWHVAGPKRWWAARDRVSGWRQALAAARATEPQLLEGDWSPASGYAAGQILARNEDVTAVVVANDDMAIGVIRALNEAGLSVPRHVSVVGFDDIPPAAFISPPLTTIHQDFEAIAERGLTLLVEGIHGARELSTQDDLPIDLVVRKSTAPPRSRGRRTR